MYFFSHKINGKIIYKNSLFVKPPFLATGGIYKVEKTEIKFRLGIEIINPQDISVVKLKSKDDPSTIDDDDELTGYATDSGLNLIGFNPTLTSAKLYGNNPFDEKFNSPHGVDCDEDGYVYIADSGNNRIVVLKNSGSKLNFYNSYYINGKPFDITHDCDGNLYITLYDRDEILVLDKNGYKKYEIKNKIIHHPRGIKLIDKRDKWNFYRSDFIAFINNNGKEIVKMNKKGMVLKRFKFKENVELKYVAIDYYSGIYVTDSYNNCVHKFDRDLHYICSFNGLEGEKSLYKPVGIDIWKRFGQVYIVEKRGGRYYWMGIDIINLNINAEGLIKYFFTDPAYISIKLYKKDKLIWQRERLKLIDYKGSFFLPHQLFKSRDKKRIEFKIEPTYSSFTRFKKEMEIILK